MTATGADLANESLLAAQSRPLRVLFDGLPALIGYWDRDLRNVTANAAHTEWFGISPAEMAGRHVREVLGDTLYRQNLPHMQRALAGEKQVFQRTLTGPGPDRRTRHAQISYVPDVVDDEVIGIFALVTDVTTTVDTQRQLDEAQEIAEIGSWSLDVATNQVTWSRQMYRLMGQDPDAFVPGILAWVPQVHPEDQDELLVLGTRARETGEDYEMRYRLVRPQGEIREVLSRVRTERSADGQVSRLTGVMQDLTDSNAMTRELSRVNEELRQVNQLNADVLGVVGHDLRAPLSLVVGHLEELSATWAQSTEEDRLARIDKAFAAGLRLASLVEDVLTMANFDSGTIATRPIRVQLGEVVDDALASLHQVGDVEVRLEGSPVSVIDPFHLRQIVTNLVSNALRYGAPPVVVTIAEDADSTRIEVIDHGEGVPEEFVPHLFERFTRAETGTAAGQPGSGFGLYIVSRLAEANRCRLTYAPVVPSGSRFRLDLPSARG